MYDDPFTREIVDRILILFEETQINLKWRLERIDQMTLSLAEQRRIFTTLHVVASRIFFDNIRTFTSRMTKTNEAFSIEIECQVMCVWLVGITNKTSSHSRRSRLHTTWLPSDNYGRYYICHTTNFLSVLWLAVEKKISRVSRKQPINTLRQFIANVILIYRCIYRQCRKFIKNSR